MPVTPRDKLMIKDQTGLQAAGKWAAESSRLISGRDWQFRAIIQVQETVIYRQMDMLYVIDKSFDAMNLAAIIRNMRNSNVS